MVQSALFGLRSRKHIPSFALLRPASAEQAVAAALPEGRSAFMAGGLDLIDRMKTGIAYDRLIFLDGIASLKGIRRAEGKIVIGALATHAEIARSDVLVAAAPGLCALWRDIANPRIRATGTIGGNLMSGLPHYDAAPALLALGAEAMLRTASGVLTVGIDRLPDHRDALLECIGIHDDRPVHLLADRSLHPTLTIYLAASLQEREVRAARIVVGCAYARPLAIDLAVAGMPLPAIAAAAADIARAAVDALPAAMLSDGVASPAYRRRMFTVLVRRLLVRLGALG